MVKAPTTMRVCSKACTMLEWRGTKDGHTCSPWFCRQFDMYLAVDVPERVDNQRPVQIVDMCCEIYETVEI